MTDQPAWDADDDRTEPPHGREYRISELAQAAGVPVRTLRYYQERKLLPPPRRVGRIGLYSEDHLARLRVIGNLLDRGHTLEGIKELLSAWEQGHDVAAVLGLEKAVIAPWSTETPVDMSLDELAELFPGEVGPSSIDEAVALGYLEVHGDRVTHWSRRQLEATVALVRAGVPLSDVLAASRRLQHSVDELADMFVRLIMTHVVGPLPSRSLANQDLAGLTDTLAQLRPGAQVAVEAGFSRAMERRVRRELDEVFGRLVPPADGAPADGAPADGAPADGPPDDDADNVDATGAAAEEAGSEQG
ncbi:MerR family transcriptional regulator [Actinomadura barringtoniae]|uniref:MerR family transcriptional regulator n=1 Tax=Actinomadura barringtoniae TaxID=1427535 RepID=UPI0027DE96B5|nr:MerR family transcriptional regulator [Actinomadura barringtoniae]